MRPDETRLKMVKTRTKKLTERWGAETSAKGTRFKLNRDLAGYHLSNRDAIEIEEVEQDVRIKLPEPSAIKIAGNLIHMDGVKLGYKISRPVKPKNTVGSDEVVVIEKVSLTLGQGDRIALAGKVS